MKVISYIRVSTEEQERGGYGLSAQASAITAECERRGWTQADSFIEVASGATTSKRPVLLDVLGALDDGTYNVLMVARLDRLTRSVRGFAEIADRADTRGWTLVCLDPNVDMSTPSGRAMAGMCSVFAQFERELISQRTKEGMAAAKARGVHCGRRESIDPTVKELILALAAEGHSAGTIAATLTYEGILTPTGNMGWQPLVVRRLLDRNNARPPRKLSGGGVAINFDPVEPVLDPAQFR